ncbi:MAG: hypothetical protein ACXW0O_07330 [Methylosarcina sp.]
MKRLAIGLSSAERPVLLTRPALQIREPLRSVAGRKSHPFSHAPAPVASGMRKQRRWLERCEFING